MKKKMNKGMLVSLVMMVVAIAMVALIALWPISVPTEGVVNQYNCDWKLLSFKTKIETSNANGQAVTINGGNFFVKKFQDPLTMKDANGNVVCFADDDFNLISQNNHGIFKGEDLLYTMDGHFDFFGDTYTIYDAKGAEIASAEFNWLGTKGTIISEDGALIAQYNSNLFRRDYIVSVFEGNEMDEDAIQMMFASFSSDRTADNTKSSSN